MKKLYQFIPGVLLALGSTSCSDFLEAYSQDMVIPSTVTDLDEVLLGSVYIPSQEIGVGPSGMRSCGFFNILDDDVNTGLGDPNGDNTSNVNGWRNCLSSIYGYFAWQLDVGTNYNSTSVASDVATWSDLYARINYVNVILDEITQLPHETEDDQAAYLRVQGEAHFLRGWFYFVLANLYGDAYAPATAAQKLCVPLKLTPYVEHDKDKPTQFQRATVKEVYDQIVADLLIAEDYLTQSPQKADHRLYRASLDAVELLLSRVYLYMQDYAQAELKAEATPN